MNQITKITGGVPAGFADAFGGKKALDTLAGGIQGGFGTVSTEGKQWKFRYNGEEEVLLDEHNRPFWELDVVIVDANGHVSKTYYAEGYDGKTRGAPDCWSADGVRPDAGVPEEKRQHHVCTTCPMNRYGSARQGEGKACGDNKRLAVVPASNMANDRWGGPMLLRLPATSLKPLRSYADKLKAINHLPQTVVTRLSFDATVQYPRVLMQAVRPLTEEELEIVKDLYEDDRTKRVLAEAEVANGYTDERPTPADVFLEPQGKPAPQAAPEFNRAAPKPAPAPVQEVEFDPETGEIFEEEAPAPAPAPKPVTTRAKAMQPAAKPAPAPKSAPKPAPAPEPEEAEAFDIETVAETLDAGGEDGSLPDDFDAMLDDLDKLI